MYSSLWRGRPPIRIAQLWVQVRPDLNNFPTVHNKVWKHGKSWKILNERGQNEIAMVYAALDETFVMPLSLVRSIRIR